MNLTLTPRPLAGTVAAIPSKSQAHRLLICAALADSPTTLLCPAINEDIQATADCLKALGAEIIYSEGAFQVSPIRDVPENALLPCRESGSTLRFLLPVAAALGVQATFCMAGRLPQRPLSPLWEELERMGCRLSRPDGNTLLCQGKLRSGAYRIAGDVSSQFISGLLFALPLVGGSSLEITGTVESRPYVDMTRQALALFRSGSPGTVQVEGDWSNAAFFLGAAALGSPVQVTGLDPASCQGDRAVTACLAALSSGRPTIPAEDIPDLVPLLAVVAGAQNGAVFTGIRRLRMKESDRVASVLALLEGIGGRAAATENTLEIWGTGYRGGTVDAAGDHRIAMAAAIAATVCREPVTVLGAEAVNKSYPSFWTVYQELGGVL